MLCHFSISLPPPSAFSTANSRRKRYFKGIAGEMIYYYNNNRHRRRRSSADIMFYSKRILFRPRVSYTNDDELFRPILFALSPRPFDMKNKIKKKIHCVYGIVMFSVCKSYSIYTSYLSV